MSHLFLFYLFMISYYIKIFIYSCFYYVLLFPFFITFLLHYLFLSLLERFFLREHNKLLSLSLSFSLRSSHFSSSRQISLRGPTIHCRLGFSRQKSGVGEEELSHCRTETPPTTRKEMRCPRQDLSQRKRSHRTVRRKKIFPYANHARVVGVDTNVLTAFLPLKRWSIVS